MYVATVNETWPAEYSEFRRGFVLKGVTALDALLHRCVWPDYSWGKVSFWRELALDRCASINVSTGPDQMAKALITILGQSQNHADHRYLIWAQDEVEQYLQALLSATLGDVPDSIWPGIGGFKITQCFRHIVETRGALQIDDVVDQLERVLGCKVDAKALLLALAEVGQDELEGPWYKGRFTLELPDSRLIVRLENLGELVISPAGLNVPVIDWNRRRLEVTSPPNDRIVVSYQFEPLSGKVFDPEMEAVVRQRVLDYREIVLDWQRARI